MGVADPECTAVCTDGSFVQDSAGSALKGKAFWSLNSSYTAELYALHRILRFIRQQPR
jgi:hypothetical protein